MPSRPKRGPADSVASPLEPSEKRVKQALLLLDDPSLRPVFVHCQLGEDRSTFIIGLYRVYFQDWTPQAAWDEMLRSGFHVRSTLRGFQTYFWRHTQKPEWAKSPRPPPETKPPSCVSAAVEVLTSIASIGFEVEGLSRCGLREEGLNMLRQTKFGGQRSMRGVAPTATRPTRGCSRPSSNETSRRCRPTCARTSWPTMSARKRPNEPARSEGPGNERSKNSLPSKPVRAPLWRQRFASVS